MKIDRFVIEHLENTLRLVANEFNSYNKKTCLDRDIIQGLICCRKLLQGEEITGGERTEILKHLEDYGK